MKNMPLFFLLILFVFWPTLNYAQSSAQEGTIRGTVKTADGDKLAGVVVIIKGASLYAITDKKGEYVLSGVAPGETAICASLKGFEQKVSTIFVPAQKTIVVDFVLEFAKISVETTVSAQRPLLSASEEVSKITITPSQIATLPSLGERDIFRAFQLLPGILGSNEASSGLYVRGGKPDQNLILYDGFTLYHVEHLHGYYSPFNPDAVQDVKLSKGGFEAKYGGRISSVMELTGREGDNAKFNFGGGASLLSLNGFSEIPLWGKGSVMIAARRSFQTPLYDSIMNLFQNQSASGPAGAPGGAGGPFAQFDTQPLSYFYDVNAKAAMALSAKDRFSISFYTGLDKVDNSRDLQAPSFMTDQGIDFNSQITDLTKWGNLGASAIWSRAWSEAFQSRVILSYSNFFDTRDRTSDMNITFNPETQTIEVSDQTVKQGSSEDNNLRDFGFKWENDLKLGQRNRFNFGLQVIHNEITYKYKMDENNFFGQRNDDQNQPLNLIGILDRNDKGTQIAAYLQDNWTLGGLTLTPGLRATRFNLTQETYLEPRFNFSMTIVKGFKLKGAWGLYHQFANRIVREDIQQGDREFWVLADNQHVPVASATHYVAGLSFENEAFLFDVEAYYKDLRGVTEFSTRFAPREEGVDFSQFYYQGTGTAKGVEFLLQKKYGAYTGWISYTLSRVEYMIPNYGTTPFPASHDTPHEFKMVHSYELTDWTFTATWIYASGRPYTPAVGVEPIATFGDRTFYQVVTGDKNSARLPAYHRLDLSAVYRFEVEKTKLSIGASIFNLYNRKNVWYKEYQTAEGILVENNINLMGLTFNLFVNVRL